MSDTEDLVPQKLMTTAMWIMTAGLAIAFLIKITSVQTVGGELVAFKDYGAIAGGTMALFGALPALRDALSPLSISRKMPRLGIISLVGVLAAGRLVHGLGLLI